MKTTSVIGLATAWILTSLGLQAEELVWFPVPTDDPASKAQVEAAFQVGSEIWITSQPTTR